MFPAEGTGTQRPKDWKRNDVSVAGPGEQRANEREPGAHHAGPHRIRNLHQRAEGRPCILKGHNQTWIFKDNSMVSGSGVEGQLGLQRMVVVPHGDGGDGDLPNLENRQHLVMDCMWVMKEGRT